ncbi:MAG TPA: arylsulfatase [Caldilineae bacterium]|nr:arylsulfatase [Caldilineae bacterium]
MSQPNIVLIFVDDMGYSDIGCYGSEIQTPNLDRLGYNGIRFTQMYNYARCCPSRASILTGLYPHQAGVGHMVNNLGHPSYQGYLNDRCVTIAEVLRAHGYRTLMSGKWHVGGYYSIHPHEWHAGEPGYPRPIDRGFEHHYGTYAGAGSYFNPHTLSRDGEYIKPEGDDFYYTDAITDNAIAMIERYGRGPEPFFLYVAYTAPHWPLHAWPEDIAKYRGKYMKGWDAIRIERHERLIEMGLLDEKWKISPRDEQAPPWEDVPDKDWEDARMAVYAAQIDRMDQGIGRIMAKLRELGIEENTLVMFLSDNGGCAELLREDPRPGSAVPHTRDGRQVRIGNIRGLIPGGDDTFMSYDLPWANASNTPFRLYKHWVHEGGIATPFIVYWPAMIRSPRIVHEPVHIIDIMPTLLELTGARYPDEYEGRKILPLEGESLVPILRGEPWTRESPLCWEHEGNRAVRLGRWKLVSRYPGKWELYDMIEDRTELNDLADKNKPKVKELAAIYDAWAERCNVLPWEEIRPRR